MDESKDPEAKKPTVPGEGIIPHIESVEKPKEEQLVEYDEKSVYVKNIHPKTLKTELEEHFTSCGTITRITICKDPMSGFGLGYAEWYEFM